MKKYAVRADLTEKERESLAVYSPLLSHLLWHRNVKNAADAENFLNPNYETHLHNPLLIRDMQKAVERIVKAVSANEKIVIYSDYDADGIPGAVVLHDFFKKIGYANFSNYIPHRHDEGFGLNPEAIEKFIADKTNLLITIDCGIADHGEIEAAQKAGIDVIVTDHHIPDGKVPAAFAILNSKQSGCEYPFNMLCGAGVAFKLAQALLPHFSEKMKGGQEKWLLDMVGIATLSDMVPLTGENRVLAHYGLKVLKRSPRPGLSKLLSRMKVSQKDITEDDIGFMISPRINAASRMGVPMDAFRLLSTNDVSEADVLAKHLEEINNERKGIVASMVKEMKKHVDERAVDLGDAGLPAVIAMGNPLWKPALLGLAASSLVEAYNRPVFLWGRENGDGLKGSCRSNGSASVVALMSGARESFLDFGGHDMAGGFSTSLPKIQHLEESLVNAYNQIQKGPLEETITQVDKQITFDDVSWSAWNQIEKLAPFGVGNPKPLFLFQNVSPVDVKQFGKGRDHLDLIFQNSRGGKVRAIAFFKTPKSFDSSLKAGMPINLVATMEKSVFGGRPELRLRIVDIIK